jgi:hypothetical protein
MMPSHPKDMTLALSELVSDFADALAAVDLGRAVHKAFQPGIGPFGEADAVRAALAWLKVQKPSAYAEAATKRLPDLLIPRNWAVELKAVRPFGDNGRPAEHWSENVLHPYPGNTSSLGDCIKLLDSGLPEQKAVVIFGFEHTPPQISLHQAIRGFELLARELLSIQLVGPEEQVRTGLVHPVHQLRVFGYELFTNAA